MRIRKHTNGKHLIADLALFLAIVGGGFGFLFFDARFDGFENPLPSLARSHLSRPTAHDPHGANGAFAVTVEPDSVVTRNGVEEWTMAVVIQNQLDG